MTLFDDEILAQLGGTNQKEALDYYYSIMDERVRTVETYDALRAHRDEYIYFRTDHHWTALGAYVGYRNFMVAANRSAFPLEHYKESVYEGFVGSFYRETESKALTSKPDTIYAYAPTGARKVRYTEPDGKELEAKIIRDGDQFSRNYKYLLFIGGDQPFAVIENKERKDAGSILVVQESFGNCFCPSLVDNYSKVYMIDYRTFRKIDDRSLAQVVEDYGIGEVLFLNNISGTREEKLNQQMKNFIG